MHLTPLTARKVGKAFENLISIEVEKELGNVIVIPLKDLTISTQFTDVLVITDKYIIGIECKVTTAEVFHVKNKRQIIKLKKLTLLNKQAKGFLITHLAYKEAFSFNNIRILDVDSGNILNWKEWINAIKN